jgi:hypothetical protein
VTVVVLTVLIAALVLGGVYLLAKLPSYLNSRRDTDE